jgi:hypothetical protein
MELRHARYFLATAGGRCFLRGAECLWSALP